MEVRQKRRRKIARLSIWPLVWIGLFSLAVFLRLSSLERMPMWVDEAESAINALTILQHGVPMGVYLGMPIYENTQIVSWPESPEYRFKDVSYSERGLAVYHGWIPLYAMAASLWAAGIEPDEVTSLSHARQTLQQKGLRTITPRIPAVLFGLAAVIVFYFTGTALYGKEAGLAAAIISGLSPMHIYVSQQARYFSATVLFSALCAYAAWQMVHRQRWRDCLLGGVAFGLLFHTHILTFLVAAVMLAFVVLMFAFRNGHIPAMRLLLFAGIVAVLLLPWIVATGFLHTAATVPSAWRLMRLPEDLILYRLLASRIGAVAFLACFVVGAGLLRYKPDVLRRFCSAEWPALAFVSQWLLVAYFVFVFLIPAASYALNRMGVMLLAPATVLLGCLCAGVAHLMSPRHATGIAAVFACILVAGSYYVWPKPMDAGVAMQHTDIEKAVSYIADLPVRPNTRLYANPNDHLLLTYYSGAPVQSIASVRETFLNDYNGDVVMLQRNDFFVHPGDPIDPGHLQRAATRKGTSLSIDDAVKLSGDLATYSYRTAAASRCAAVLPPLQPLPDFAAQSYIAWLRIRTDRDREYASKWVQFPMFRGFQIRSVYEWWTVFFFRFINPQEELRKPNYETRMRTSVATILPGSNWAVYYSPR
jgi:hypothetical protein